MLVAILQHNVLIAQRCKEKSRIQHHLREKKRMGVWLGGGEFEADAEYEIIRGRSHTQLSRDTDRIQDDLPHFYRKMTRACLLWNEPPPHPTSTPHTKKVTTVSQTQLFLCVSHPLALSLAAMHIYLGQDNRRKHAFAATNVNWKHWGIVKAASEKGCDLEIICHA